MLVSGFGREEGELGWREGGGTMSEEGGDGGGRGESREFERSGCWSVRFGRFDGKGKLG